MDLYIPKGIKTISDILNTAGYQCYLVGGAIRNQLLGKKAKDFDLTTDAEPETVIKLFKKVIPTGIKHGTVTILINSEAYEITTYRIDGKYTDGRRPDKIEFTPSIEEDLIRRDFTINSIAYNIETDTILDINRGIEDLDKKVIKAIGEPKKRFSEDALRLVRACRFASQLNFEIEPATYDAIKSTQEKLGDVSKERIAEELLKILSGKTPSIAFVHFYKTGMMDILFPELYLEAKKDKKRFYSALKDMDTIETEHSYIKLSRLLYILPEKSHYTILKDLKLSNKFISSTIHLIKFVDLNIDNLEGIAIRKVLSKVTRDYITPFLDLIKGMDRVSNFQFVNFYEKVMVELNNPLSIKELNITGNDLIKAGYNPGPDIGILLEKALNIVLENPANNDTTKLLKLIT